MSLLGVKPFTEIFCEPILGVSWENELIALLRIVIAGLLGLVVGYERSRRKKEAGLATHFIVACASALFTCISTSLPETGAGVDGERIAAQVVSGVGFLGAGMIFFRRENLRGLTTAAGIWATAAIGMAVAVGQIIVAVGFVIVYMVLQWLLHLKRVKRNNWHMISVKFVYSEDIKAKVLEYFSCDMFHRFKITKVDNQMIAEAVIYPQQKFLATELSEFMSQNDEILSIERLEDL